MWRWLEKGAGLHLEVTVDDIDREVLWRSEQTVDAILTQGVDDEHLLVVDIGGNGVLVIVLDAVRLLVDEVAAILVDEEDDQQLVAAVQLAQVGQLSEHASVVKKVGIENEQASLPDQMVHVNN